MKINNKKIIVSTLALAMGAALAGSISGSVAWYQYSTRAAAQIAGTTAGTEGRLQIAEHKDNHQETDWDQKVDSDAASFRPISAKIANNALTFYDHPVYQVAQLPTASDGFVDLEYDFRFQKNTEQTANWQDVDDRNIYLSHFAIVSTSTGDNAKDVSSAVRVAFLGEQDAVSFVLSKNAAGETTTTKGYLDLNDNDNDDTTYWDCQDDPAKLTGENPAATKVEYTNGDTEEGYATGKHGDYVLSQQVIAENIYSLDTAAATASTTGGAVPAVAQTGGSLKIRIWVEGWALLNNSADWTRDYINQNFDIQMQFVCKADAQ